MESASILFCFYKSIWHCSPTNIDLFRLLLFVSLEGLPNSSKYVILNTNNNNNILYFLHK